MLRARDGRPAGKCSSLRAPARHLPPASQPTNQPSIQPANPHTCPWQDELYEEAALLRSRELGLRASLGGAPEQPGCALPVVTVAHVEEVVAAWSGVPVQAMAQDERTRLAGLDGALRVRAPSRPCLQPATWRQRQWSLRQPGAEICRDAPWAGPELYSSRPAFA